MISSIGDYPLRFAWAVHSYGDPSAVGDETDVYADPTQIWGTYDGERTSSTVASVGAQYQEQHGARLRFRGYPSLRARDKLTDPLSGEVWLVLGSHRGDLETIVDAYYLPAGVENP